MRGHHRRAGVAGAEERGRAPSRTASAATRIDARGLRRSAAAAGSAISMRFGRVEDLDVERALRRDAATARARWRRVADEQQPDLKMPRGDERPVDDAAGRVVAAHRVDGDAQCQRQLSAVSYQARSWQLGAGSSLRFFDRPDLAALVVAAVRADLVRRLGFLALRAGADRHRLERVVRAALGGAASSNAGVLD